MVANPGALVATDTILGREVMVGPFCYIGFEGDGPPLRVGADSVLRSHVVLYRGTEIGRGFHAGHSALVRGRCRFGDNVSIGSGTIVEHHVRIEDEVRVHSGCFIPEYSVLKRGAWVGPGVLLTNARYPNRSDTKQNLAGVTIGEGSVVGAGAVILPGVVLGPRSFVGAGSVVTRDVEEGVTVAGNPARVLK